MTIDPQTRAADDRATTAGQRPATVAAVIDEVACRTPAADAARFPDGGLTYDELRQASRLAARRLLAAGVRPGDRVGVMLPAANEDYIAICLGALRFGAVALPINARYKVRELEHIMRHAEL